MKYRSLLAFILISLVPALQGQDALVQGQQELALKTYAWLAETYPEENIIFSPTSLQAVLAIVAEGAAGQTKADMLPYLDPVGDGSSIATDLADLGKSLRSDAIENVLATAFYSDLNLSLKPAYLTVLETLGTRHKSMSFVNVDTIIEDANGWVSERTNEMITDLVTRDLFQADTVGLWLAVQYLKGQWTLAFDEENTAKGRFTLGNGSSVTADFMSQRFGGVVREDETRQLISAELALKDTDFAVVFLQGYPTSAPDSGTSGPSLSDLEARFTTGLLRDHLALQPSGDFNIKLPKFNFKTNFPVHTAFKALGITTAFESGAADFSALTDFPLYLQKGVHEAVIELNEAGLEAAGATALSAGVTSLPRSLAFDQPFIFIVYHKPTEAILFMGRITNPAESSDTDADTEGAQERLLGIKLEGSWTPCWLGYADVAFWPWVQSVPYGWLYSADGSSVESAWFFHSKGGWIWSGHPLTPLAWSANYGWIYQHGLILESHPPQTGGLWWYIYETGEWISMEG